MTVALVKCH